MFRIIQLPQLDGDQYSLPEKLERDFQLKVKRTEWQFHTDQVINFHLALVVTKGSGVSPYVPDFSKVVQDELEEWVPNGIVIVYDTKDSAPIKAIYLFEADEIPVPQPVEA